MTRPSSRLSGFYKLSLDERRASLAAQTGIEGRIERLADGPLLDLETASHMVENVIGIHGLPLGIGLNFRVNDHDYLVPMVVEEPSVVAAASNAARMVRQGGGFHGESDAPIMIAQVQLLEVPDTAAACARIEAASAAIIAAADASQPSLRAREGGTRSIEVRVLSASSPGQAGMLVVHLHVDVRDAMGANLVNTMAEAVADRLAGLSGGQVGLRILSNLADRRCARVRCSVPVDALATPELGGRAVAEAIVSASRFAELDPYRAATHNKGIMNGVDAVVMATGNDWRGIEAGAHAFAARSGTYRPLAVWRLREVDGAARLEGTMEIPMAVGTVGGATRVHPGARLALDILGVESASELGLVTACVGLASNLAALRALATEGIQRGHMTLHARTVALEAGATGELVERVAAEMARRGDIRREGALAILSELGTMPLPASAVLRPGARS